MTRRTPSLILLTLLLSAAALAQQQQFGESLEIRVLNVDVVVTDRNGNPITGLTQDDFELYENGQKRDISNFSEIDERAAATATAASPSTAIAPASLPARRHLVLFIDNSAIQPGNRNRVLPELKTFVLSAMRPGDDFTLYTWNPGLKTGVAGTTDRAAATAALDALTKQAAAGQQVRVRRERAEAELRDMVRDFARGGGTNLDDPTHSVDPPPAAEGAGPGARGTPPARKPEYSRGEAAARAYAESVMFDLRQKVEAMKAVVAPLNGLEGKKIFVFLTESFSMAPAREIFEVLDAIKAGFENGAYANPRSLVTQYSDETLFEQVVATANASGVTLYPVSTSGSASDIGFRDASMGGRRTLDNGSLAPLGKGSDQSLREIADQTGGVAVTGTTNFKLGFDRILGDLTTFYSLGYRAADTNANAMRKVEVKLRKPGYVVRTRESFAQKTLPTEVRDTVVANALQPAAQPPETNDLQITIIASAPTSSGLGVIVPVEVRIPLEKLTLVPDGDNVAGRFTVYTSFYRTDGSVTQGEKREQKVKLAASAEKPKNVRLRLNISADSAVSAISVGVVDEISRVKGFAKVEVK